MNTNSDTVVSDTTMDPVALRDGIIDACRRMVAACPFCDGYSLLALPTAMNQVDADPTRPLLRPCTYCYAARCQLDALDAWQEHASARHGSTQHDATPVPAESTAVPAAEPPSGGLPPSWNA
jgi:hypothetical protein